MTRTNGKVPGGPVLSVEDLAVAYKIRGGEIEAVQDVTFDIQRGEAHGIVGESGCGKSTVTWAILNFLGANGYVKRGSIKFWDRSWSAEAARSYAVCAATKLRWCIKTRCRRSTLRCAWATK